MREKMKKLPIPVTILIAFAIMGGFVCTLAFSGIPLRLITNIENVSPYLRQMFAEILLSVYGMALVCALGQTSILKTKGEGWLKSSYIAAFFIGYIVFDFIAQLYVQSIQTEHNIQPFGSVLSIQRMIIPTVSVFP